jgi:uncharacterized protein
MSWIILNPLPLACYLLLFTAVILLWVPQKDKIPHWLIILSVAVIVGLASHQLELVSLLPIILLAIAVSYSKDISVPAKWRYSAIFLTVCIGAGLNLHKFPGFHHLTLWNSVYLRANAISYTLNLNMDKTICGILLLGFGHQLIHNGEQWLSLIKQIWFKIIVIVILILTMAIVLRMVNIDPKYVKGFWLWAAVNLLSTCIAEEAFFRGFIQTQLTTMLHRVRYGTYLALLLSSILFGLSHFPGGVKYTILASMAGLAYGWIYQKTKRIEACILVHFSLNLTHFLLFTYPAINYQ